MVESRCAPSICWQHLLASSQHCARRNDEVDCVLTGHVLLTEKPRGVALSLGEYRHKKLRAGPIRTTPPLCVERRALKASGVLGIARRRRRSQCFRVSSIQLVSCACAEITNTFLRD
jgi:hypothetical protein